MNHHLFEPPAVYFFWAGVLATIGAIVAFIKALIALRQTFDAHLNYHEFKYRNRR